MHLYGISRGRATSSPRYNIRTIKVTHSSVIYQILADMDDDWRASMRIKQHLHLMTTKANASHFFSNTAFSFTTVAGVLYLLGDYALHFLHLTKNVNTSSRQFPVKIQFPFEHADESPTYEVLFVILFLHSMVNGYSIIILDALIFSLVSAAD